MKLTAKGRSAVTALVDLAINSVEGKPVPLSEISKRQSLSVHFLEQIFLSLKNVGIVKSVRGSSGGYLFARETNEVMVFDVINAIDEKLKITGCNGIDFGCVAHKKKSKCLTHNLWNKLTHHISDFLNSVSIYDVMMNNFDVILSKQNLEKYDKAHQIN
tara:strand:+ start:1162 stop:1638 length:477 start_codon:yes stop_codon:yes gene_type:complete